MTAYDLIRNIARQHGLTVAKLRAPGRCKRISKARQEAMWALWRTRRYTLKAIGHELGGRDHSTVVYGIRRIKRACERDEVYEARLRKAAGESITREIATRELANDIGRLRAVLAAKERVFAALVAGSDVKAAA